MDRIGEIGALSSIGDPLFVGQRHGHCVGDRAAAEGLDLIKQGAIRYVMVRCSIEMNIMG